ATITKAMSLALIDVLNISPHSRCCSDVGTRRVRDQGRSRAPCWEAAGNLYPALQTERSAGLQGLPNRSEAGAFAVDPASAFWILHPRPRQRSSNPGYYRAAAIRSPFRRNPPAYGSSFL